MVYCSVMPDLDYISKGNDKTQCYSFDLPAVETCPGRTKECSRDCYAVNLMQAYPSTANKYYRNYSAVWLPTFVTYMVETIPQDCEFRIHVSGDFFHSDYVKKWIEICSARPDVTFYSYTRSWRIPEIFFYIQGLHDLPNVNINLSVDDETGAPTERTMRWCYLTKNDSVPDWIRPTDIVFRSNHSGRRGNHQWRRKKALEQGLDPDKVAPLIHRLGGIVCPFERGRKLPQGFSCAKCHLCVLKPKVLTHV